MIERIHTELPDTEILLLGSMVPNYESTWYGNQELFAAELLGLEESYDFVAVANVTEMHKALFSAGKRYRDVTGNNINHPNDFVARLYALPRTVSTQARALAIPAGNFGAITILSAPRASDETMSPATCR